MEARLRPRSRSSTPGTRLAAAKGGIAAQLDPTDVHEAELALQRAESAWSNAPDEPSTVDTAMVAQRRAQIAEAEAASMKAQKDAEDAKHALQDALTSQLKNARGPARSDRSGTSIRRARR